MGEGFARIPNDIFHNSGVELDKIGGRDSFLVYCLLVSRKNGLNQTYITLNQIMETLDLLKNKTRHRDKILQSLEHLVNEGYIKIDGGIEASIHKTMQIEWVDQFVNSNNKGWIPFYYGDFELYHYIGAVPYLLMWLLRTYSNHKTDVSFVSISMMADILKCNRNAVQATIRLFRETGLFEVKTGDYYYSRRHRKKIRQNNEYSYIGDTQTITSIGQEGVNLILNEKNSY